MQNDKEMNEKKYEKEKTEIFTVEDNSTIMNK